MFKRILAVLAVLLTPMASLAQSTETLIVAGGCFWCVEADFEKVKGVKSAVSGFTGGDTKNPTYKQVTGGKTGHYEAVQIKFDPSVVSRDSLLSMFLRSIDPTDAGGQFCDRGASYRTAIFASNAEEVSSAKAAIQDAETDLGQKIVTPVLSKGQFYPAEAGHQDYYKSSDRVITRFGIKKKAKAYQLYRDACGRDQKVRQLWGAAAPFAGS